MIDKAKISDDIPANKAIQIAKQYVQQVYADTKIYDLMLEEVSRSDDDSLWLITVGFSRHEHKKTDVTAAFPHLTMSMAELLIRKEHLLERDYKVVEVDVHTGDVKRMRIRDLRSAS